MTDKLLFETKPSSRRAYLSTCLYALPILIVRFFVAGVNWYVNAFLFALLGLLILRLLKHVVKDECTLYRISDQYIEVHEGIIARKVRRAPWTKVSNFVSEQTAQERLLGLINILIDTPGHDEWEIEYLSVTLADGQAIMAILDEYVPDAKGPEIPVSEEAPASQ